MTSSIQYTKTMFLRNSHWLQLLAMFFAASLLPTITGCANNLPMAPSFNLSPSASTLNVPTGARAGNAIQVIGQNGFQQHRGFGCIRGTEWGDCDIQPSHHLLHKLTDFRGKQRGCLRELHRDGDRDTSGNSLQQHGRHAGCHSPRELRSCELQSFFIAIRKPCYSCCQRHCD